MKEAIGVSFKKRRNYYDNEEQLLYNGGEEI